MFLLSVTPETNHKKERLKIADEIIHFFFLMAIYALFTDSEKIKVDDFKVDRHK